MAKAGQEWFPKVRTTGVRLACAMSCLLAMVATATAETLSDALVKTYQTNPQLNAERARQRGTDENIPQALAGYRPQLVASLGAGLQAVRNLLPDNTVQSATLKPWTIGLTVTQVLFNGNKTANNVRIAEFQVKSGREALRNVEQGVLLEAYFFQGAIAGNTTLFAFPSAQLVGIKYGDAGGIRTVELSLALVTTTANADSEFYIKFC